MVFPYIIQSEESQNSRGFDFCKIPVIRSAKGAYHDLFKNIHSRCHLHNLKRPTPPFLIRHEGFIPCDLFPFEDDFPGIGLVITDNAVEERRLPSAIGANQTDDLALMDLKGNAVIRYDSTKIFDEIDNLKKCHV